MLLYHRMLSPNVQSFVFVHPPNLNVLFILGYLRRSLLSLFIKSELAPKCGVAWFIMKGCNKSSICFDSFNNSSWTFVRSANKPSQDLLNVDFIFGYQSWSFHQLNCIFSYHISWLTFMEISSHPEMHPQLIIACSMLSLINFSQLVRRDVMLSWPTFMRWIAPWIDAAIRSWIFKLLIIDLISSEENS